MSVKQANYADVKYTSVPSAMDIVNVIRNEVSGEFKERIPQATQDNIAAVGNPILNYEPMRKIFLDNLFGRVGQQTISSMIYNNMLKFLKKGMMEYGDVIQEIFVPLIKAEPFFRIDDLGMTDCEDLFKRRKQRVLDAFHKLNRQDKYPLTINEMELRQAFVSWNQLDNLISAKFNSVKASSEYDEYILTKNLFFEAGIRKAIFPITIVPLGGEVANKQAVKAFRLASRNFTFMSPKYNMFGVKTATPTDKQLIFMLPEVEAEIDVDVLSAAFNMDKADFIGRRLVVDDFGGLEKVGVKVILADVDWFQIYDVLNTSRDFTNGARLYTNYFYHIWQVYSYSPFRNIVAFTTTAPTITGVTVTPNDTTHNTSEGFMVFEAEVTGTGLVSNAVDWTTTHGDIRSDGLLHLPSLAVGTKVTVTATSKIDTSKIGTATITITA